MASKVKKNSLVVVLTGKDRGKKGRVIAILPKKNKIKVESVAVVTKHVKPRKPGDTPGIKKFESYIDISNVMTVDG